MNISIEQRMALFKILDEIEEGARVPRIGGEVGRFLQEFAMVRRRVAETIRHEGQFIRGATVGSIVLTPLAALQERVETGPLGEVASTVAVSEELAGTVNVTLWGKPRSANALRNVWLIGLKSVALRGSFRWFAPRRITPGAAEVSVVADRTDLFRARCLKFAGVEFLAAPPAASYRWDSALGPPDLRVFRVAGIYRSDRSWAVVPVDPVRERQVDVDTTDEPIRSDLKGRDLALALITRTPWESRWTAVRAAGCDADDILSHLISWGDHRRELESLPPLDASGLSQLGAGLIALGYSPDSNAAFARANLSRSVPSSVRRLAAWLRGIA